MSNLFSKLALLEKGIGYCFQNKSLLVTAVTHTSYANEHGHNGKEKPEHNQRLEFLGDSVLSTVISTYLYRHYPDLPEGNLSKLRASVVCESALAEVARRIRLQDYLLLGVGEEQTGGRDKPSILADAMESLIAALYLDSGYEQTERVLLDGISMKSDIIRCRKNYERVDYKTLLQETVGKKGLEVSYRIVEIDGPPHACVYVSEVSLSASREHTPNASEAASFPPVAGRGRSKKEAEQNAAKELIKWLHETPQRP